MFEFFSHPKQTVFSFVSPRPLKSECASKTQMLGTKKEFSNARLIEKNIFINKVS